MKLFRHFTSTVTMPVLILWTTISWAGDLPITGPVRGSKNYDSPAGIVFNGAVLDNSAVVTATSTFEVRFMPGTRIESGGRLVITMRDNDGLSNRCEMTYFGNLDNHPGDDYDGDQLTNIRECQIGTDPTVRNPDNDSDNLPDGWELRYGATLGVLNSRNGDYDGDGISNWIEYKLGTDPTVANAKGPGIHYRYDPLGRIRKIERIPSQ